MAAEKGGQRLSKGPVRSERPHCLSLLPPPNRTLSPRGVYEKHEPSLASPQGRPSSVPDFGDEPDPSGMKDKPPRIPQCRGQNGLRGQHPTPPGVSLSCREDARAGASTLGPPPQTGGMCGGSALGAGLGVPLCLLLLPPSLVLSPTSPSQGWVKSRTGCRNSGLSDPKPVGPRLSSLCQSDHYTFTPAQMTQHRLLFSVSSQSWPGPGSPWPHRLFSMPASVPGWPPPPPEGASIFLTVCHCSLLKENSTSPTFAWRELDHHLPTNEARLCKQREERRQVVCLSGRRPRSWHPRCLRGSVHMFRKRPTPSWFGTSPGDVCLGGWESRP